MKEIEKLAGKITARYGTNSPFSLCDCIGISVVQMKIPQCMNGFYFKKESGESVIVLSASLSQLESGYCCAHELGHVLLHPKLNAQVVTDLTNLCVQKYEREADYFAACLFIDPNINEWNRIYDPLTLEQIASLSGLPERVVGLRFAN